MLNEFAQSIGATVAATRGAVEMGLAPVSIRSDKQEKPYTPKFILLAQFPVLFNTL